MIYAEDDVDWQDANAFEAVGYVASNRINDVGWPDTYDAVINQQGQFDSVGGDLWNQWGNPENSIEAASQAKALSVATEVYYGTVPDPTDEATYFRAVNPNTYIAKPGEIVIGHHVFY